MKTKIFLFVMFVFTCTGGVSQKEKIVPVPIPDPSIKPSLDQLKKLDSAKTQQFYNTLDSSAKEGDSKVTKLKDIASKTATNNRTAATNTQSSIIILRFVRNQIVTEKRSSFLDTVKLATPLDTNALFIPELNIPTETAKKRSWLQKLFFWHSY